MKKVNKNYLDRYSRQIIIKNIGISGQKKISSSKIIEARFAISTCPL